VTPRPRPRDRASAATVLVAVAAFACGRAEKAPPPPEFEQLRAFTLVPPPRDGGPLLLAGRWEVREGELRPETEPADAARPASWVDRSEARAFAAARGARLPTLAEWRHLAGSPQAGTRLPTVTANTLELGFHGPLPVGVFERGKSPEGCFDLAGNLWEWVDDDLPGPLGLPGRAAACGGGFGSWGRLGHAGPNALRELEAGERADDLGFRLVADAAPWIEERLQPVWREVPAARDAARAAFATWRPELRADLAGRLRQRGVDAGLCDALEEASR
jgi:hypothetical protein